MYHSTNYSHKNVDKNFDLFFTAPRQRAQRTKNNGNQTLIIQLFTDLPSYTRFSISCYMKYHVL